MRAPSNAMRFARFSKKHLSAFNTMLTAAEGEFGAAWAAHMKATFSRRGCARCGLATYAVTQGSELAAVFATRKEVEAFVLYFILVKNGSTGGGIGGKIVERVEKMARASGAKFLRADIYSGKPVIGFYKKLGFKKGGRVRFYEEDGDDQTFLYKRL